MNQSSDIPGLIRSKVAEELLNLPPHLQRWLRTHLVEPRLSRLSVDHNGSSIKHFWLVTDHNGEQDLRIASFMMASKKYLVWSARLILVCSRTWEALDLFQILLRTCNRFGAVVHTAGIQQALGADSP